MMGKTHITIGIAASLAVCQPKTVGECCAAVLGGAAGGILCDIECNAHNNKKHGEENGDYIDLHDKQNKREWKKIWTIPRLIVLAMFLILLPLDYFLGLGICKEVMVQDPALWITGAAILLLFCFIIGRRSKHRKFTHSILYVILFSIGIHCISPMMGLPAMVGGFSHLYIDMLNRNGILLFFPFPFKICLPRPKLQSDDGTANEALLWAGLGADILLISLFVMTSILPVHA